MKEIIFVVVLFFFIIYIGMKFYNDNEIDSKGTDTNAIVTEARQISANESGSINGEFLIEFLNERNEMETLRFRETIPQLYASQVQPGMDVKIKYLRSKNKVKARFIFK